jgi:hypothetical protein
MRFVWSFMGAPLLPDERVHHGPVRAPLATKPAGIFPETEVNRRRTTGGPWRPEMLYYNNGEEDRNPMTEHHHHHHPQGHAHPPALAGPSILRLSAFERLGFAAVLIALVWAAVFWAMH